MIGRTVFPVPVPYILGTGRDGFIESVERSKRLSHTLAHPDASPRGMPLSSSQVQTCPVLVRRLCNGSAHRQYRIQEDNQRKISFGRLPMKTCMSAEIPGNYWFGISICICKYYSCSACTTRSSDFTGNRTLVCRIAWALPYRACRLIRWLRSGVPAHQAPLPERAVSAPGYDGEYERCSVIKPGFVKTPVSVWFRLRTLTRGRAQRTCGHRNQNRRVVPIIAKFLRPAEWIVPQESLGSKTKKGRRTAGDDAAPAEGSPPEK